MRKAAKEQQLFEFMIENVVRVYMKDLSKEKIAMLDELGDWKSYYESKIISAWIGKIIHEKFNEAASNNIDVPYEIIIQTVMREISGAMKYSGIAEAL